MTSEATEAILTRLVPLPSFCIYSMEVNRELLLYMCHTPYFVLSIYNLLSRGINTQEASTLSSTPQSNSPPLIKVHRRRYWSVANMSLTLSPASSLTTTTVWRSRERGPSARSLDSQQKQGPR
ncbi:hypothetical protein GBAR_LOCUS9343 [Geodia barretti]|uniref:Uncharacterized protein n=1 Tax=Geodia barretti TaxID=519541 RepID=A0AA35RNT9_GEOBA|nr:hypothetical protein GBAR_LOCUS9343 [Geodia barretti]